MNTKTRHTKTVNIKRNLIQPSNYSLLLGTKLILEDAHKEAIQYVLDAANHGYVVKFLTAHQAMQRASSGLAPKFFHPYSYSDGQKIKRACIKLLHDMINEFYDDLLVYSQQAGIPPKELSTASLHIKQLAYLSHYLTYKLEGKPRKQSPLAIMRAKLAAKREPIQMRIERKRKTGTTVTSNKPGTISNQYQQPLDF